jgi:hypothetical protein
MSLGALVALSARAHLLPSNRAGCNLLAASGRSCSIHQRESISLRAQMVFFARYVVLLFPFFIPFSPNKAHIGTKLCVYQNLWVETRLSETKTHIGLQHLNPLRDQPSVHRKLVAPATSRNLGPFCNLVSNNLSTDTCQLSGKGVQQFILPSE